MSSLNITCVRQSHRRHCGELLPIDVGHTIANERCVAQVHTHKARFSPFRCAGDLYGVKRWRRGWEHSEPQLRGRSQSAPTFVMLVRFASGAVRWTFDVFHGPRERPAAIARGADWRVVQPQVGLVAPWAGRSVKHGAILGDGSIVGHGVVHFHSGAMLCHF